MSDQSLPLPATRCEPRIVHSPWSFAKFIMLVCLPVSIDLQSLRKNVQQKLCDLGMLEPDQFPITERNVVKADRVCGVLFCLHGPRSVKFTAIADFDRSSLIVYGSDGTRSHEEKLDR